MANYLARVAASGAASRSNARPAVVAPPILPGRGLSNGAELPGSLIYRTGPISDAQLSVGEPPLRPAESASTQMPATHSSMMKGDPHPPTSETPSPAVNPAVTPQPQRAPAPGLQSTNANLIRAPRPLEKSDGATAQPPQVVPFTPSSEGVIRAPKSFSMTQMPRFFDSAQASGKEADPQSQEPVFAPGSTVDINVPVQKRAQRALEPTQQQIAQPAAKSTGIRQDPPQVPASNAIVDLPPNGAVVRRDPKITIGQIDVQVINTPAPVEVPAASTNAADSSGYMSAELDRFRWRLR